MVIPINNLTPQWPAPNSVRAVITTRQGGVSSGLYASNNLALHVGDDAAQVQINRNNLHQHLQSQERSLPPSPQWLTQIHGVKVIHAKKDGVVRTADGSYTNQCQIVCTVMTADCLPILLCDKQGTQVAALHCGWKSLAKGICARGVKKFCALPSELMAYLGPAISQHHFEVGVDVLEAFFKSARDEQHREAVAQAFKPGHRPLHFYADIYALARAELISLGVTAIYGGDYCTYADQTRFYSYRRDKLTGRMASLIWLE